ncbi:MAG: DoxX family protein [Saprospiraceae bacterium]|nr:DoxX family protein [Saprospiraceae bacterium]
MVTLSSLIVQFAVAGVILTAATVWAKQHKHIFWTFLQHFCGVWFLFSGLVKAVDPIGTAYKMEDYFAAFEQTFAGLNNVFSGLAPLFPLLSKYANGFSIGMIVLELVLGVMLILGTKRKLTAWLFFITMVFFTVLTGFTFLTGYVPSDANFFDFAKWGPYIKTQMRVTDCGCFGDFIVLDPKISFFKDLGLMIPAFLFLFGHRKMHELFTAKGRNMATLAATAASLFFCYQNTYLDLPMVDFRPFKIGSNIRDRKELESKAKVDILGWVLENTNTGQVIKFMEPEPGKITYYKQYPKADGWTVKDQIQTDWYVEVDGQRQPITKSKVSDFAVEDGENGEVTEDLLTEKGYSLMIVAYKLKGQKQTETVTVQDTTWATDTIRITTNADGKKLATDSFSYAQRVVSVTPRQEEREVFIPEPAYGEFFSQKLNPLAEAARKAGWKVYAITTIGDAKVAGSLAQKTGADYPFYKADDKLLKTIIRANPGVVVLKDGAVMDMYHHRHIPAPETLLGKWK